MIDWLMERNADFVEAIVPDPILDGAQEMKDDFRDMFPRCHGCGARSWDNTEVGGWPVCGECAGTIDQMRETVTYPDGGKLSDGTLGFLLPDHVRD